MSKEILFKSESPSYLLLNTPLSDPTSPYHSLSYLVGHARSAGFSDGKCVDVNIDMLEFMLQPDIVNASLNAARLELFKLEGLENLSREDQLRYRFALKAIGLSCSEIIDARDSLRDESKFFNPDIYTRSILILNRWLDILSLNGIPGQFENFGMRLGYVVNFSSTADLSNGALIDIIAKPFAEYWRGRFLDILSERDWQVVGLSVNYVSQLPLALKMLYLIREKLPSATIVLGGTEITDLYKGVVNSSKLWSIFKGADALVIGEGESAFVDILEGVRMGGRLKAGMAGIFTPSSLKPIQGNYPVRYEKLEEIGAPAYDIWDNKNYWAPYPILLFSPTRGCYWNRCTFCDYGLNQDSPTAPARDLEVETAVDQLEMMAKITPYVYFAVDSMSPVYLHALCQEITKRKVRLFWSAELRLEPRLRKGLAKELRDAGCVSISFGFESASQRVLNMIDKGVKVSLLKDILEELKSQDIGAQMMGFIGFPGETSAEAEETFNFLLQNRGLWTLAGIGDFVLTPGAMIAKSPEKFGLFELISPQRSDVRRVLYWRDFSGALIRPGDSRTTAIDDMSGLLRVTPFDRPWVGGMDTAHSIMYFARNGRMLFMERDVDEEMLQSPQPENFRSKFANIENFTDVADVVEASSTISAEDILGDWLASNQSNHVNVQSVHEQCTIQILANGSVLKLKEKENEIVESHYFQHTKALLLRLHGMA